MSPSDTNCIRIRMFWVFFLLIGSITCFPPPQGVGVGSYSTYLTSAGQDLSKPIQEKPTGQASGSGSYVSYPGYYHAGTNTAGSAGSSGSGSQLYSGEDGHSGASGSQQVTQESWTSTDGEEPVFTPVHDEDQVYAFKSRSRYNQKRLRFSQFRYTPTEPLHPEEPVFQHSGKGGF